MACKHCKVKPLHKVGSIFIYSYGVYKILSIEDTEHGWEYVCVRLNKSRTDVGLPFNGSVEAVINSLYGGLVLLPEYNVRANNITATITNVQRDVVHNLNRANTYQQQLDMIQDFQEEVIPTAADVIPF